MSSSQVARQVGLHRACVRCIASSRNSSDDYRRRGFRDRQNTISNGVRSCGISRITRCRQLKTASWTPVMGGRTTRRSRRRSTFKHTWASGTAAWPSRWHSASCTPSSSWQVSSATWPRVSSSCGTPTCTRPPTTTCSASPSPTPSFLWLVWRQCSMKYLSVHV